MSWQGAPWSEPKRTRSAVSSAGRMTTALDGIAVLDFSSGLPGALTTMVLCDNGADVIKVEPPAGDPDRRALVCPAAPRARGVP